MLIDMHNHTKISSPCSLLTPEELIEAAKSSGLDAICVTEHSRIEGANLAQEIGHSMNFTVFRGIEVSSSFGDMLVFGYYKDIPDRISIEDLCWYVHEVGGVVFAAHPYYTKGGWNLYASTRGFGWNLDKDWKEIRMLQELDGFEIVNGQVDDETNERAKSLAKKMNKPGIAGSDAHSILMVARAATRFEENIKSEEELIASLKKGQYHAVRLR